MEPTLNISPAELDGYFDRMLEFFGKKVITNSKDFLPHVSTTWKGMNLNFVIEKMVQERLLTKTPESFGRDFNYELTDLGNQIIYSGLSYRKHKEKIYQRTLDDAEAVRFTVRWRYLSFVALLVSLIALAVSVKQCSNEQHDAKPANQNLDI